MLGGIGVRQTGLLRYSAEQVGVVFDRKHYHRQPNPSFRYCYVSAAQYPWKSERAFVIAYLEDLVRYSTAAILSVVLIGGMFVLPLLAEVALGHYVEQGLVMPLSARIFFGVAFFCARFHWLLALPIAAALFTLAALTSPSPARK